MKISIGSDHAGYELKTSLKNHLDKLGHEVSDEGTFSPESVDYPDIAHRVATSVETGKTERGVLVCGTGIGMCISANRHKGVRAAQLYSAETASMSRRHNDSNIACFGARITDEASVISYLDIWLKTDFEGGRHIQRLHKIDSCAQK